MKTIKIYGSSDDLIYFANIDSATDETYPENNPMCAGGYGEFYPEFRTPRDGFEHACFVVCDKVKVYVTYGHKGIWRLSVARIEEDDDYPDWPTRIIAHENGYSMQLEIDVPLEKVDVKQVSWKEDYQGQSL